MTYGSHSSIIISEMLCASFKKYIFQLFLIIFIDRNYESDTYNYSNSRRTRSP